MGTITRSTKDETLAVHSSDSDEEYVHCTPRVSKEASDSEGNDSDSDNSIINNGITSEGEPEGESERENNVTTGVESSAENEAILKGRVETLEKRNRLPKGIP
jgi:hypothetical protein